MAVKMFFRTVFVVLLILGWGSSAGASSKCYFTFNLQAQKGLLRIILNNPTTEILEKKYFLNFEPVLPFTFDDKGRCYSYQEGKRRWIGAISSVQMGENLVQRVWLDSDSRINGITPDNNYYFFSMAKIASETDYVVSNIFSFHLDNEYQINEAKEILWSDLPVIVQASIRNRLNDYFPIMEVNASVDHVIDELNIDKRYRKMPIYDSSVYSAAQAAFSQRMEGWLRSLSESSKEDSKEHTSENSERLQRGE